MELLDERTLIIWLIIVAIVAIVSLTGMFLNRFFIYRAHRKALEAFKTPQGKKMSSCRVLVQGSEHGA
ncbi:MAG: hypothetical protein HFJ95_07235 [Muribaculaceae bacterium]|nr:hypothetical protein [Muribaculaceae bacterium]